MNNTLEGGVALRASHSTNPQGHQPSRRNQLQDTHRDSETTDFAVAAIDTAPSSAQSRQSPMPLTAPNTALHTNPSPLPGNEGQTQRSEGLQAPGTAGGHNNHGLSELQGMPYQAPPHMVHTTSASPQSEASTVPMYFRNPRRLPPQGPAPPSHEIPSSTASESARVRKRPHANNHTTNPKRRTATIPSRAGMPVQLPTPHDSPTSSTDTPLLRQFNAALDLLVCRTSLHLQRTSLDNERIGLLREACRRHDMFYILAHSIYCAYSVGLTAVLTSLALFGQLDSMQILQDVWGSNHLVTKEILDLFLNFPTPAHLWISEAVSNTGSPLESVKHFLQGLPVTISIGNSWMRRGWPPCPLELKHYLRLPSPVLSKAFYAATLRKAPIDQEWLIRALCLFDQELNDPGFTFHPSVTASALYQQSQTFGQKYCQQLNEYMWLRHGQPPPVNVQSGDQFSFPASHVQPPLTISSIPVGNVQPGSFGQGPAPAPVGPGPSLTGASRMPVDPRSNSQLPQMNTDGMLRTVNHTQVSPVQGAQITQNRPPLIPTGFVTPSSMLSTSIDQPAIPQPGLQTNMVPHPDRTALHQAHLRSPTYEKVNILDDDLPSGTYYRYVDNIITMPQPLDPESGLVRWNVEIPHSLWTAKAETLPATGESQRKRRKVSDGCTYFRLKCIVAGAKEPSSNMTVADFCARPTKWPRCLSASINGNMGVDFRREVHHGADLATDVTDLLREGNNEMVVCVSFKQSELHTTFLMAIEVIRIADKRSILSMPTRISAEKTIRSITAGLPGDEDDELSISANTVGIVDPFMSSMWLTPVRGKDCPHTQCFDLDAFLESRPTRGGQSVPEKWKCPFCGKYIPPPTLVIDEFFVKVRGSLESSNKLDARAILVNDDGTWEVKNV